MFSSGCVIGYREQYAINGTNIKTIVHLVPKNIHPTYVMLGHMGIVLVNML
jgi:hypothetical protein